MKEFDEKEVPLDASENELSKEPLMDKLSASPESDPVDVKSSDDAKAEGLGISIDPKGGEDLSPSSASSTVPPPAASLRIPQLIAEAMGKDNLEALEILQAQKKLQEFILSLIKSFLRSGYYHPDHPQAHQAKSGLYQLFQDLMVNSHELTFLILAGYEEKDLLLDGYLPEPTALSVIMSRNMGEIFIPKFVDFFERKALRACTIKKDITRNEFEKFIEIMSWSPLTQKISVEEERSQLMNKLDDHKIFSISAIFEDDIIGKTRRLPWRVELTITRLNKDLSLIPLYRDTSREKRLELKRQIFQDIFRPLKRPDILAEVFINADLIAENLSEIEELHGQEIEREIVTSLPELSIMSTTKYLLEEYNRSQTQKNARFMFTLEEYQERLTKLMIIFAEYLILTRSDEGDKILKWLYDAKIVTIHELPAKVQKIIRIEELTNYFENHVSESIELLQEPTESETFELVLEPYADIIPELLLRENYDAVLELFKLFLDMVRYRARAFPPRQEIVRVFLRSMLTEKVLNDLMKIFTFVPGKLCRTILVGIYTEAGDKGLPFLFQLMSNSDDKWIRKAAIRGLEMMGTVTVQFLIEQAELSTHYWYVFRNILFIWGNLRAHVALPYIIRFLTYPNPMVRVEALTTLYKVSPETAGDALLKALTDDSIDVQKKAVDLLSSMQCHDYNFLNFLRQVLNEETTTENEHLQIHVCMALKRLGDVEFPNQQNTESLLISNLVGKVETGLVSRFKRLLLKKKPRVQIAMVQALGCVADSRGKLILKRIARGGPVNVQEAAKEALEKSGTRTQED